MQDYKGHVQSRAWDLLALKQKKFVGPLYVIMKQN